MPKVKMEIVECPLSDYEIRGGRLSDEQKAERREKTKKFFKDFSQGFVKGFTKTLQIGAPIVKKVIGLGEGVEGVEGKPPKRKLTAYNKFIKDHYHEVKHLPNKERFAELSKMWRNSKK